MDISTLFFGSGFALLITLLAWGNQMREPRQDVIKLENECRQWLRLSKSEINPLLRQRDTNIDSQFKFTTTDRIKSLMTIMGKHQITSAKQIVTIRKLDDLNQERAKLEGFYRRRYLFIISFTILLFVLGFISNYTEGQYFNISSYSFSIDQIFFVVIAIPLTLILKNLIFTYVREEKFIMGILEAWDSIEE